MLRKIGIIFILICVATLSGCVTFPIVTPTTYTYTYSGKTYSSPQQALDAEQADLDRVIRQVFPTKNPVGGRALVVLPSRSLIEKYGVAKTGNPAMVSRDMVDFIVSNLDMGYRTMADALRARNIFDEVVVRNDDKPEMYVLPGYDAIIYLALLSQDQAQWYLKLPQQNKEVPIYMDLSRSIGIERVTAWLDNIEKNTRENLILKENKN
jgi:uncharacterized SAM-binding protein YcdF (DUF218 family)